MNSAVAGQPTSSSELKKRKREIDHNARRQLLKTRLLKKGHTSRPRAEIEANIKELLSSDVLACDLLMSLFATSLRCYRRASICNPFPEDFIEEGDNRQYADAELYTTALPSMQNLKSNPSQLSNLPLPALKLLSFVVETSYHDEFTVKQISLEQYKSETSNIDSKQSKHSDPNYIFKLDYTNDHPTSKDFEQKKQEFGSTIGFHGSMFENFHSIVRSGLDSSFGKETSLFGDGIYLSSDRDVAFSFLKSGPNLSTQTQIGQVLGCLVCAEVACRPKSVRLAGSAYQDDELPKGYIVAEDNDCVLVKYILVYKDFQPQVKSKSNICLIIAIIYGLLLLGLWLMRSTTARHYFATYSQTSSF